MRKRIVRPDQVDGGSGGGDWLDLEERAEVEITSEDPDHPIESALLPGGGTGWRAAEPGPQTLRLLFSRRNRCDASG